MKNPEEDVPLSDGEGYMVGKEDFEEYLRLTEKVPEMSTTVSVVQCSVGVYSVRRSPIATSTVPSRIRTRRRPISM